MINPLNNVPLNTTKSYVRGITRCGCEVYMPVKSDNDHYMNEMKIALQEQLDNQPYIDGPDFPLIA